MSAAALPLALATPAGAVDLRPSIFTTVEYDSNLTRSADEDEAELRYGTRDLADLITSVGVGLSARHSGGRSDLSASGNVSRRFYTEYDSFNATNADATAAWNYSVTSNCGTGLRGNYSLNLASFEDVQTTTDDRNLQTRWGAGLSGQCRLFERITIAANADYNVLENESDLRTGNDRETIIYGGSVSYSTPRGDSFGVRTTVRDNHFPNASLDPFAPANRDFTLTSYNVFADIGILSTLRLNLAGGIADTDREASQASDSTRGNGDGRLIWTPTARTTLSGFVRHSISEVDDFGGGTRESTQYGVSGSSALTNRISVNLSATYSDDEFFNAQGDPTTLDLLAPANADRSESRITASAGFTYALTQVVGLAGGLRYAMRESDFALNEYESYGAFLTLSLSFGAL